MTLEIDFIEFYEKAIVLDNYITAWTLLCGLDFTTTIQISYLPGSMEQQHPQLYQVNTHLRE